MRRVLILGSTGSIGTQALDVIAANRDRFEVVGLAAGSDAGGLAAQAAEFGVERTALGVDETVALVRETPADVVLNGITGSVGLAPTLAALEAGATLALANKESLIVGGELVTGAAAPGQIVPVDSEHSALAQALRSGEHSEVRRLVLTASGGPFRGRDRESLRDVTPAEALARTWQRLRKPSRAGEERLFFELAAMAMYRTPGTEAVADDMVDRWIALAGQAGVDVAPLRVDIAVIRGLLLDLLLTGDRKGTDAALKAYVDMRTA